MKAPAPLLSYSESTSGIKVTVYPQFVEQDSEPEKEIFVFAYTVTIENLTTSNVQVLRRHWIVKSGGVIYAEVKGDGVVGEQPLLEPGDIFQYTSSSMIKDSVGSMQGTYTLRNDSGQEFEVAVPTFDLICPQVVH